MAIAVGLGITSCSDVTDINVDPNSPTAVPAANLVTQAQFSLYDRMHSQCIQRRVDNVNGSTLGTK